MDNYKEYMDEKYPGLYKAIKIYNRSASSFRMAIFLRGDKLERGSFEQRLSAQNSGVITNEDSILLLSFGDGDENIQLSLQILPYGINTIHRTIVTSRLIAWLKLFQNLLAQGRYPDYVNVDYDAEASSLLEQDL